MGIPLWKSILFFVLVAAFSLWIFPTQREMGLLFTKSRAWNRAEFYLAKQYYLRPDDHLNTLRYFDLLVYQGNYTESDKLLKTILKTFQLNYEILGTISAYLTDRARFSEAAELWSRMTVMMPGDVDVRDKLLAYRWQHKEWAQLAAYYEGTLRERADLGELYQLGSIYLIQNDARNALTVYLRLLERFPFEEPAQEKVIEIYKFLGEYDRVLEILGERVQKRPDDGKAALEYAEVFMKYGAEANKENILLDFAARFPEVRQFEMLLLDRYWSRGDKAKAFTLMRKMYAEDPENTELARGLADFYFENKEYAAAKELLEKVHRRTGGDYKSHHLLGDILIEQGERARGRAEYETALEMIQRRQDHAF